MEKYIVSILIKTQQRNQVKYNTCCDMFPFNTFNSIVS